MRRRRTRWIGPALAILFAAPIASAQTPPTTPDGRGDEELIRHLADTPMTLLDWGMLRLERDLDRAVRRLGLDRSKDGPPRLGTLYRFADRRILAYVSFIAAGTTRTEAYCRDIFGLVRQELLAAAPGGPDGAAWYLERIFSSDVRRDRAKPEPYGEKLLSTVQLEVTLRAPASEAFGNGPGKVACAGRLDQEEAFIVPPPKPQG